MFDVSRASWRSSDATGAAHTAWTRAVDGASEEVLFAYSVGTVGVGRDDGWRQVGCVVIARSGRMQGCGAARMSRDEHSLSNLGQTHEPGQGQISKSLRNAPTSVTLIASALMTTSTTPAARDRPVVHAPCPLLSPPRELPPSTTLLFLHRHTASGRLATSEYRPLRRVEARLSYYAV